MYNFLVLVVGTFLKVFFRIEIEVNGKIDENKAYIIAANHRSNLDPLFLCLTLKKISNRNIHFLAKKELFKNNILKYIFKKVYMIPIDRKKMDIFALKESYKVLKQNHILGIFPEGTRVKDDSDVKNKAGVGMFAVRTNSPIIPVSIVSDKNYRIFSKIKIIYNPIYEVPLEMKNSKNSEDYLKIANDVMKIIKG